MFFIWLFLSSQLLFAFCLVNSYYLHLEWSICKDLFLPSYFLSSSWFLSSLFHFSSVSTCFCKLVVSHGGMLSSLFYVLWIYSRCFIVVITSWEMSLLSTSSARRVVTATTKSLTSCLVNLGRGTHLGNFFPLLRIQTPPIQLQCGLELPFRQVGLSQMLLSLGICPVLCSPGSFFPDCSQ